jgi:thiol-disulfide isomerase/thioredoxin
MKTRNLFFLSLLLIAAGCSSTTVPNPNTSFTNADPAYMGNVSGIYAMENYGTVGSWTGVDIKWKDSNGVIRAMSAYGDSGKPVLLSFWSTTTATAESDEPALDSVQKVLGDSVGIVTINEDNFQTAYKYDTLNKISVQIVVDSAEIANLQYVQLVNSNIGWPETFIIKPNGTIMAYSYGYATAGVLDSLARAAYH